MLTIQIKLKSACQILLNYPLHKPENARPTIFFPFRFTLLTLCKINQLQCSPHNFFKKKKINKSRTHIFFIIKFTLKIHNHIEKVHKPKVKCLNSNHKKIKYIKLETHLLTIKQIFANQITLNYPFHKCQTCIVFLIIFALLNLLKINQQ